MNRQFVLAAIFVILSPLARAQQLSPKPENLLLITVDALRADHLGCYGYSRPTSPRMDRLAAQGTVFESVQPTIPRTTQSLAALFSGLYPQRTGVLRLENDLPDSIVTMAEVMTAAGYDTACFVTHPLNLIGENGNNLQQGFAVSQKANKPTVEALSWFQSRQHKPFFVWLHYYDPHWRYEPSRQYDVFSDPIYRNPDARSAWNDLVRKPKGKIIYQNDWSANDVQHAIDLYDGEILEADAQIGELLDWLDSAGLLATTLIAVSADHGEGLGEHGYYFDHGETLYQGVTRVPLIFSGPGIPSGRRVKPNVELFDLFPTLVELMGAPPPPGLFGVAAAAGVKAREGQDPV